jgi:glycerol-3-phosphate dehydrogenase
MSKPEYDICVIGGGINGAGIARDAAGRGLSVLLIEKDDLASATSSASSKLIHGGLRYLEYYEFGLVRKALKEREVLLGIAPHIISPMEFVLPHDKSLRPAWMIRTGLFFYDHLAKIKKLFPSKGLDLNIHEYGAPLKDKYKKGFSYADCWVDDARLVVLNAMDAKERGADIKTRTECISLREKDDHWEIELKDSKSGKTSKTTAAKIVNAAGPWVRYILDKNSLTDDKTPQVRLVKGSHIVTGKIFDGQQSYILQQPDKRIVFVIPYENDFTLIGTTDVEYSGNPSDVEIDSAEIAYLCESANRSFNTQISRKDIVWQYSGVRPLLEDGDNKASAVTRDYRLEFDEDKNPALLSVFGGKITTYRELAEEAVDMITGQKSEWTQSSVLPGGDITDGDRIFFLKEQKDIYPWLPDDVLHRYVRSYGTLMEQIIGKAKSVEDLGQNFGDGLYEAEVNYLVEQEWAITIEDILWRRSKLGLHISKETLKNLEDFLTGAKDERTSDISS